MVEHAGQGDGATMHAPFPKAVGQRKQTNLVLAMLLVAAGPSEVATAVIRGKKQNMHVVAGCCCVCQTGVGLNLPVALLKDKLICEKYHKSLAVIGIV